jgi:hypothetical protein
VLVGARLPERPELAKKSSSPTLQRRTEADFRAFDLAARAGCNIEFWRIDDWSDRIRIELKNGTASSTIAIKQSESRQKTAEIDTKSCTLPGSAHGS